MDLDASPTSPHEALGFMPPLHRGTTRSVFQTWRCQWVWVRHYLQYQAGFPLFDPQLLIKHLSLPSWTTWA